MDIKRKGYEMVDYKLVDTRFVSGNTHLSTSPPTQNRLGTLQSQLDFWKGQKRYLTLLETRGSDDGK